MGNYSKRRLFLLLVSAFGIFYLLQIPFMSSNSDVLIYSLRAKNNVPISSYAFYEKTTYAGGVPLPNYHIGHTYILWQVYQFMPDFLKNSIWPSGFVSSMSAAITIGVVFLIWLQLGMTMNKALLTSIIYGLIPTIWHHALIGEVYSLQFVFVYLFFYLFLKNKLLLSAAAFTLANLVSPLSGLSFSLLLLGENRQNKFKDALLVGFLATMLYALIMSLLGFNPLKAIEAVDSGQRNLLWRIYRFALILILNLNAFIFYFFRGLKDKTAHNNNFRLYLILSISPYILLGLINSQFLVENGSFLLILFWASAYFIATGITQYKSATPKIYLCLLANALCYFAFWNLPSIEVSLARNNSASLLTKDNLSELKIMGSWSHSVALVIARDGWDIKNLSEKFIDISNPRQEDLAQTKEDSLLVVYFNRDNLQSKVSKVIFPNSKHNKYDPCVEITSGQIELKQKNRFFVIYLWIKNAHHHPNGY